MTDVQTTTGTELSAEEPGRSAAASTRRNVLLGAGAVGATAVLAACGSSTPAASSNTLGTGYSDKPGPAGSAAPEGGGSGTGDAGGSSGGVALAKVADVPEGGGIISGDWVITQPTAGEFKAFTKVCPHAGCAVDKVKDGQILCPCHGSKFSIQDGSRTAGPANKGLDEKKVKADGADVVEA